MTDPAVPPVLRLDDMSVSYRIRGRAVPVLSQVNLSIAKGEVYGLVGESGSGKSTVALAVQRVLPANGRMSGGRALINGRDVGALDRAALLQMRAREVAMVFQDPGRALNPSITIGRQVAEAFEILGASGHEARRRAEEMLTRVRISSPARVMERYPHQLSGGMQQRVVIAMALAKDPSLLILDEPTTGLDATIEAEILDLVDTLRREFGASILFISHNLGAIAGLCDRVGVLYAGRLVEEGPVRDLFADPRHPYTAGLLRCLPRPGLRKDLAPLDTIPGFPPAPGSIPVGCVFAPRCALADETCRTIDPPLVTTGAGRVSRCHHHDRVGDLPHAVPRAAAGTLAPAGASTGTPVLELTALSKTYGSAPYAVQALRDVSLRLMPGQTLGLVGESGSGKSTLAHALLGLIAPDAGGGMALDGAALAPEVRRRTAEQIKTLQIVFQNPDSALNRSHSVRRLIGRAITRLGGLKGAQREAQVTRLLESVRLTARQLSARPRQLSGGMKQRVAVARAFAGNPRLVVCDEPTSALDVSVQAAILNLLAELQAERQVAYLLISHDLGVVRYLSDWIAVLYLGRLLEVGPAARVLDGPHHPYTEALLSAAPSVSGERTGRIRLTGAIPSGVSPPAGCLFHTRCPRRIGPICDTEEPPFTADAHGHAIRCHLPRAELGRSLAPATA
ncbi:peptide/nickel transport system ATP-binding protein [Angulomicrobium tetraedrale]|uniref:Peptide/nickel transport system ATP-binding protein n=1 Tax=Ancylobacter tetraedralis TaxID=217068 RepID=A0A839Z8A3_9HYPH|nr:ABC transporter ATP-binding protein [Ancylobacter tetraedralis]MBB3769587.1 peptide/nickel transport system ATP-binding protein [Ancylobacter tetraedralis]